MALSGQVQSFQTYGRLEASKETNPVLQMMIQPKNSSLGRSHRLLSTWHPAATCRQNLLACRRVLWYFIPDKWPGWMAVSTPGLAELQLTQPAKAYVCQRGHREFKTNFSWVLECLICSTSCTGVIYDFSSPFQQIFLPQGWLMFKKLSFPQLTPSFLPKDNLKVKEFGS